MKMAMILQSLPSTTRSIVVTLQQNPQCTSDNYRRFWTRFFHNLHKHVSCTQRKASAKACDLSSIQILIGESTGCALGIHCATLHKTFSIVNAKGACISPKRMTRSGHCYTEVVLTSGSRFQWLVQTILRVPHIKALVKVVHQNGSVA